MQIVIKCLLDWSTDNQVGQEGVFGILETWARTDEEQGRKTPHGHWRAWIFNINKIRETLHSKDPVQRE